MEALKATRLAAIVLLLITGMSVVLAYVPGTQAATMYSVDDNGPDGISAAYQILSSRVETHTIIGSVSTLLRENVSRSALMIIGPYKTFSSDEISSILFLLARGTSVIIVSDFGTGNQILTVISYILYEFQKHTMPNATFYVNKVAFNGSVLMDAVSYIDTPANPLIVNILHDQDPFGILTGVNKLATYMPTTITAYIEDHTNETVRYYWTPLPGQAMTTQYSRLETDLNSVRDGTYEPDSNERGGIPFSVLLYYPMGDDQFIMLISDPDIFTNRFVTSDAYDNRRLVENIANFLASKGYTLYIDQAHQPALPITSAAYTSIVLRTIAYFTLFPIVSIFVPRSIYTYLKRMFPEYEARGILLKKARRRTAYEFNPDARKALERNDFTEPLKLLYEKFKQAFASRYGSRSKRFFKNVAARRKVPKKLIKVMDEIEDALSRGGITRDEFVLFARSINELSKLLEVRRYVRSIRSEGSAA